MSDSSWIDHIPSQEREKIRKRLRSPEEYERLREKVKGPEDLEREMEKNAEFAEARLALESDPKTQEKSRDAVRAFASEQGTDAALEGAPTSAGESLSKGNFDVVVTEKNHEPCLAVKLQQPEKGPTSAPSGNVSEVFPLKPALQQQILSSFTLK